MCRAPPEQQSGAAAPPAATAIAPPDAIRLSESVQSHQVAGKSHRASWTWNEDNIGLNHQIRNYRPEFRRKNCHLSSLLGTATSKNPTIISSEVWSPHRTALSGSGLCGLFLELSYQAIACNSVPAFSGRGSARR